MPAPALSPRKVQLRALVAVVSLLLFFRVLVGMLAEYRWYFPPDFDQSAFLGGRRYSFHAGYAAAFYVHILSGPPAVLLGLFLILSGSRPRLRRWHRLAGRSLALIALIFLVPSGLVMARQAYAGPIAAAGFTALSLATGACIVMAAWFAVRKDFRRHQHFAVHSFLLLASPLLLRLVSGVAIVVHCESELYYQLTAWLSWLVPLGIYETWSRWNSLASAPRTSQNLNPATSMQTPGVSPCVPLKPVAETVSRSWNC